MSVVENARRHRAMILYGHVHGDAYVLLPGFSVLGASALVRVHTTSGAVMPVVMDPAEAARFDMPLSVAFSRQGNALMLPSSALARVM